ncbi:MAG TPA: MarC family protein [Oligoflexia bacterium]|nr:MarC family protein [Oligoflexia bacterium]HMR25665.1 MarC family protein [Oligoflexia bacterium]
MAGLSEYFPLFLAAFVPLFVAMDVIGVLPIYISLIDGLEKKHQKIILIEAIITIAVLGTVFIFLGKGIFNFLGISVADFKVAGGLILLILSISDLLFAEKVRQRPAEQSLGVVPLGMPLIVGPATLTALIVQVDAVGTPITLVAYAVNLIITFLVFLSSQPIMKVLGKAGTQAFSKIANLMLAAIAVMIIRSGLSDMILSIKDLIYP